MRTRLKLLPILLSLVLAVSACPAPALAADLTAASSNLTTQTAGTDDYPSNLKNAAKDSLVDPWRFYNRECTSFVAWRLNNDNGVAFTNYYRGAHWGNANNWGAAARSLGIAVDSNPPVGSVAWWNSGTYGHVAWVQSVSGNNVTIEEYNYNNNGAYHRRTVSKSSVSGFIHIKDLGSSRRTSGCARVSVESGTYLVQSKIGNRVIDIHNASQNDGENAKVWQPVGNTSQIFNIGWNNDLQANYIQLKASGKFLDAEGGDAKASNVVQWFGNGGKNQNWVFEDAGDGYVYIRNLLDYYLDLANLEDANGANVQTWEFNGGDNQKWKLVRVSGEPKTIISDGSYIVQSKVGNRVIDIHNASTEAGENAKVWQPAGNASQIFNIGKNDGLDANYIQLKASGLFLDSEGGGPYKGNVSQYSGNNGWNQNWFAESAGDGYYYIRNLFGYYLDLDNGKDENGANVATWEFNGDDNQKWKLLKVSGEVQSAVSAGTYSLVSKQSGKALDIVGASTQEGANAQIRAADGSASQLFEVAKNADLNAYSVKLKASGLALDAEGVESKEVNVSQYTEHGGWNQNWFFENAGGGYFYVRNMLGYYLDVEGAKTEDGSNVGAYIFNGGDNQKWKLVAPSGASQGGGTSGSSGAGGQPSQGGADSVGKTAIGSASVTGVKAKTYTGKALTQSPTVKVGSATLKAGTDYELTYANNVKAGTAAMTIAGKGSYTGTKAVTFAINKANVKNATAAKVKAQKYKKGKAVKPSPKITYKGNTLEKGADYTLQYKNNKKRGTATITVKGEGNFQGSKTVKFKIK